MSDLTPAPADLFLGDVAQALGEADPPRRPCAMVQSLGRAPLSLPGNCGFCLRSQRLRAAKVDREACLGRRSRPAPLKDRFTIIRI